MTSPSDTAAATRVFLRPLATPLPLGFVALALATTTFAIVQLGWIPPSQAKIAALTAVVVTAPLQVLASVFGYLARDPIAGTGLAVQGGTWLIVGLGTLLTPTGVTSPGLGVLLITAALGVLVPAVSGKGKLAAAGVMGLTAVRFGVTGGYELTGASSWKTAAGAVGLALAVAALYSAFALELEGARRHTILPVGRSGLAAKAAQGEKVFDSDELAREPGVRPRL